MGKILALDIGEKRVGVAISDQLLFLAHPLKTIQWQGFELFLSELKSIIEEHGVTEILVGVPYTLKGNVSQKTAHILQIIKKLRKHLDLPIMEWDESLSTKQAHGILHRVGKKPSKQRNKIDQIAAVIILQEYLDSK
jgi:putative Holliday junction resolvase